MAHLYQCLADGSSATRDPLLKDFEDLSLCTDKAIRIHIYLWQS